MSGISNHTVIRISTETCSAVQKGLKRREFSAEDLVLQKVVGNTRDVSAGKLAPT